MIEVCISADTDSTAQVHAKTRYTQKMHTNPNKKQAYAHPSTHASQHNVNMIRASANINIYI